MTKQLKTKKEMRSNLFSQALEQYQVQIEGSSSPCASPALPGPLPVWLRLAMPSFSLSTLPYFPSVPLPPPGPLANLRPPLTQTLIHLQEIFTPLEGEGEGGLTSDLSPLVLIIRAIHAECGMLRKHKVQRKTVT